MLRGCEEDATGRLGLRGQPSGYLPSGVQTPTQTPPRAGMPGAVRAWVRLPQPRSTNWVAEAVCLQAFKPQTQNTALVVLTGQLLVRLC